MLKSRYLVRYALSELRACGADGDDDSEGVWAAAWLHDQEHGPHAQKEASLAAEAKEDGA